MVSTNHAVLTASVASLVAFLHGCASDSKDGTQSALDPSTTIAPTGGRGLALRMPAPTFAALVGGRTDAPDDVEDPVVTAGNASSMNDGAAALVVVSEDYARVNGLEILARVTGYATGAVEPRELFFAPIQAVRNLMRQQGTSIGDYDLIEANEAFAVQALADGQALSWDWDRVNVKGGAIALGHPIGASGARVLVTLLHAMRDRDAATGLATLCLGGGDAVALAVERA